MKHSHVSYERELGDIGFQLRELAETLDTRSFQALSSGLGLGKTTVKDPERSMQIDRKARPQAAFAYLPVPPVTLSSNKMPTVIHSEAALPEVTALGKPVHTRPRGRVLLVFRRLVALSIDLGVVVASLALALALATTALTLVGDREAFWMEGGPLKWFAKFSLTEIGVAVLTVFLCYLGIFRLFAGRTVGGLLAQLPARTAR